MGFWESLLDGMEPITGRVKYDEYKMSLSFPITDKRTSEVKTLTTREMGNLINNIGRKRM